MVIIHLIALRKGCTTLPDAPIFSRDRSSSSQDLRTGSSSSAKVLAD